MLINLVISHAWDCAPSPLPVLASGAVEVCTPGELHRSKPVMHSGSMGHKSAIIIMCREKASCATFPHSIGALHQ